MHYGLVFYLSYGSLRLLRAVCVIADPFKTGLQMVHGKHNVQTHVQSTVRKGVRKEEEKAKKFSQNFADSYLVNGLRDLFKICNVASPSWRLTPL